MDEPRQRASTEPAHQASPESSFISLDADRILATIDRLAKRVEERFPGSGLSRVAGELRAVSLRSCERVQEASSPIVWVRVVNVILVAVIIGVILATLIQADWSVDDFGLLEGIAVLEAAINDVVLICAGIFFLVTIETRIKRGRFLRALHELRSIAHVIDMHQLTKDPEYLLSSRIANTASSPNRAMSAAELGRYLDYCSEMLSLTGKLAALYVQNFNDSVVLTSVNEIESLTTGLSRKIWQKLMIVHSRHRD